MIEITQEERELMLSFRKERDKMAQRIGVAVLEHNRMLRSMERKIDESLMKERTIANQVARKYGLDPERVDFRLTDDGNMEEEWHS